MQAAAEPVKRYGHLVDAADWASLAAIFTDGATVEWINDQGNTKVSVTQLLPKFADFDHPSAHHATNILVDVIDSDRARVSSKGLAVESDGRCWSVTYDDIVVRTPDGWRIARRVVRERPSVAREQRTRAPQTSSTDRRPAATER